MSYHMGSGIGLRWARIGANEDDDGIECDARVGWMWDHSLCDCAEKKQ